MRRSSYLFIYFFRFSISQDSQQNNYVRICGWRAGERGRAKERLREMCSRSSWVRHLFFILIWFTRILDCSENFFQLLKRQMVIGVCVRKKYDTHTYVVHALLLVTVSATHLIDCVHSNVIQIFFVITMLFWSKRYTKKKKNESFSVSTPGTAPFRLLCAVGSVEWAIIRKREHVQPSINISLTKITIEFETQVRVQDLQDSSITY